jgi:DNA polymerase elongation subunit (family B)
MHFYTNVFPFGDQMFVRGYDNGRQFSHKIEFYPTLYVGSKKRDSQWRTLDGTIVDEVKPGSVKETRDFVKRYEEVKGFDIFGNTNYTCQYISDSYESDIKWDMEHIKVFTIDIETQTENGFPDIKTANEDILLITVKDLASKRLITFGTKAFVHNRDDVIYLHCEDETHMLREFISWWQQNYPDVITGWNTEFFDVPYLIRRIERELGEAMAKKISPWGYYNERKTFVKGTEEIHYDIHGISHLDFLALYKKFTYTKQESYRLDYIAEQELGDRKKENPGDSFKDFYTNHWQQFVEYNIQDVELVDRMEDKMRLIELCLTMAYNAKINYEDVFSQVRMWDAIIYNHLRQKKIAIPAKNFSGGKDAQFEGAYVKDPLIGLHKWVASFDLNSLYPHLIMQYNISPETLTHEKISCSVESLLNQEVDTSYAKRKDLSLTANGYCYRKDIKGFMPELMEKMYKDRSKFKKQMLKVQQEYEHDKKNNDLRKEISRLNNLQMAMKIALNSAYGAMGNQYFRYFDIRMAEGITTSGQLSIRWMANEFNKYMNKLLKTESDYVIAIDTDSIYLSLEDLVEKVCEGKTTEQKIKYMDKICEEIFQPFIDTTYQKLSDYMNSYSQKMIMKREVLADKGIWTAKKRYILNVHNSEGVQYAKPKIKVMGLEMVKSSTPSIIRDKLKESIPVILDGDQTKLHDFIEKFRSEYKSFSVSEIAFPRGVNGIKQYAGSPIYSKGTPIHVRGALLHNHYLKKMGIDKVYQPIRDGDKIKFVYVKKPNPFQEDVISFAQELPSEFGLHRFIDYDLQFEKTFLDALQTVIEPLGWNTEPVASLEDFF